MELKLSETGKESDLEFLKELDKKLHYKEEMHSAVYGNPLIDYYTEKKLTSKEIEKIMKIIEKYKLPFYPVNTNMGFSVGFAVRDVIGVYPLIQPGNEILKFKEDQLPKGYDFDKLSEVFLTEESKELLDWLHLPEIKERNYYTY